MDLGLTTAAQATSLPETNLLKLDTAQNEAIWMTQWVTLQNTTDTPTATALHTGFFTDANYTESRTGQCILQCSAKKSPQSTPSCDQHKRQETGITTTNIIMGIKQVQDGSSRVNHTCMPDRRTQAKLLLIHTSQKYLCKLCNMHDQKRKALYLIPVIVS